MKKFLFTLALIFSVFCNAKADSPLTSTDFWRAYSNEEIIIRINADDISSNEILNYLVNKKNPVAVKMAVVNRMGWDIEGMSRAEWLYTYAAGYYQVTTFEDFCKKAPADVLLCYAYLLAMDDYFNVGTATSIASIALIKNPKSYTIQIIAGLIRAQYDFDSDWCKVFNDTDNVRQKEKSLKNDMNAEAKAIIFEYMDLYSEYCND